MHHVTGRLQLVNIYIFLHSEFIYTIRGVTPKNYAIGYDKKKNIAFLKLSLTTLFVPLLLRSMQISNWKSIGQYDYPKLVCFHPLNIENFYMEY